MKQKQSAPYWPASLVTLCTALSNRRQDASSNEEEEEEGEEGVRGLMEENLQLLEEEYKLQDLQNLCGALQGRGERVSFSCILFIWAKSDMFTSLPQTYGKVVTLRPLLSTTRTLFSLVVLVCLFFFPRYSANCLISVCPAAAAPGNSGISGGERRPPAEEEIPLHPEEAGGAHQQVPEAVHPETKCSLLTAQIHSVRGAELVSSLLEAQVFYSFLLCCS